MGRRPYDAGMEFVEVYNLRNDPKRIEGLQAATMGSTGFGLKPEPHLVGSEPWWESIQTGDLPTFEATGQISRVRWGSMGDWPEFDLSSDDGEITTWTREGDHTRFVKGLFARVRYVLQHSKDETPFASALGHERKLVLSLEVEDSPLRSEARAPGPFKVGEATTLWRPTGPEELALLAESNFRRWPPRLPEQPIFYPVLNEEYATQIARDWNTKASGVGYVTRFDVESALLLSYDVHQVGGSKNLEYWIPAEELENFNDHIVGEVEVVAEFRPD